MLEQPLRGKIPSSLREIPFDDQTLIEGDPAFAQGLLIACQPIQTGSGVLRTGDGGDTGAPLQDQVDTAL
jgi:hypothetical protein